MELAHPFSENYVQEYSIGGLIRATIRMYGQHFGVLFLITLLPTAIVVSITAIVSYAMYNSSGWFSFSGLHTVNTIATYICLYLSYPAIVVAISEISLGIKPTVKRSFKRMFAAGYGNYLAILLLQFLYTIAGLILLVIPAFIFGFWYMLTAPVFILENAKGKEALKRSKELGKGFYLRSFCIVLLIVALFYSIYFIIAIILYAVLNIETTNHPLFIDVFTIVMQSIFSSFVIIPTILIYFDLRVRKEGYSITSLAEDLQH